VLKGIGVARVSKKMTDKVESGDVFTNFDLHKLERPEIIRMDFTHPTIRGAEMFDAIVCDPPYGIRAASKKFGKRSKKDPKLELTEEE
jgi:tRNA (guanine10-N2)-methyltransferase